MKNKLAVGIVIYKPDKSRLKQALNQVLKQNCPVFLYKNSNDEITEEALTYVAKNDNVYIFGDGKNRGLAFALNELMKVADDKSYDWMLTLDQDSVISTNMINSYYQYFDRKDLGIIAPQVIDHRRKYMKIIKTPREEYVSDVITSGSCTNINAWKRVGKFDSWLFIDLIDNEFCKRLRICGYKILKLNYLVLDQEFGKIKTKSPKKVAFYLWLAKILRNQNWAKFSYKKTVDPMRVFYTSRNIIYVNKKLKKYGKVAYQNYNCKGYVGFIFSFLLPSFLRADHKGKVASSIVSGTIEGLKKEVEVWQPK